MLTATGLKRSELAADGRKLLRYEGKQVLVIAREGRVFAIANRCPHEGYPLSEGHDRPGMRADVQLAQLEIRPRERCGAGGPRPGLSGRGARRRDLSRSARPAGG